jgi:3',5'-cyclic AMP phosphodiesterase CpdA
MPSIRPLLMSLIVCAFASSLFAATSAQIITSSSQFLIGPEAVGQVGDVLLANENISVVISAINHPHSRANTGGNIVDAALTSDLYDAFGQLYTYLNDDWPRQANYTSLTIVEDGNGGLPAQVRVQGIDSGNSSMVVITDYFLADGATEVMISSTLTNNGGTTENAYVMGDATEWENCESFAPGYGFGVSGTTYEPWIAAASGTLAYGYFAGGDQMWGPNGNGWADINVFSQDITPGGQATYLRYFFVGQGGVASVSNRAHEIAGLSVGTLAGSVVRDDTGAPLPEATVDVYDESGNIYTQMVTDATGLGEVTLTPGNWRLIAGLAPFTAVEQWYTVNTGGTTAFSFLLSDDGSPGSYALGDILTVIQKPLLNIPAIVEGGHSFTINCQADPATTGWAAMLQHGLVDLMLNVESAHYNSSTTWWDLVVSVPSVALHELYDLRVTANGGLDDTSKNAVQVIESELQDFYFLHITDTHLPTNKYYDQVGSETDTTEVIDLRSIIQDAELINPAFVLHTGDLINEGELEDFEQRRYYSRSQQVLGEFTVPVYLIAGNHDIGGWNDTPPSDGTARRDWWRFYGWSILDDPPPGAPLRTQNYSFDYGGVHFTALEAYDNYDLWRSAIYGEESFTSTQMNWLANDLAAASGSLAQVLFYHFDFSNQLNLNSLGVEMALWGHIHSDQGSLTSPPYDLSTDQVCNGGRSYRFVRVTNGVLDPRPTLSAGSSGQNLTAIFTPSNFGAADTVEAMITNNHPERFQNGRLVFSMPNYTLGGAKSNHVPVVEGGTLVQVDNSGETSLWYVDVDIAASGRTGVTAYYDIVSDVPASSTPNLVLHPGHPNPFNPRTTLDYSLPRDGHVRVAIIDLRGREVAVLVDEIQAKGDQSVIWNGLDGNGQAVPSSTYIAHVRAAGKSRTTKITLAR